MNFSNPMVYIVDDDEAVRDSLTLMLQQENIPVSTFSNGEDFLSTLTNQCHGCLILDIRMPGMDGMQLQQKLISEKFQLPIVFLTGHGDIPQSVSAIKSGAVDFLTKPITREQLLGAVKSALKESELRLMNLEHGMDAQSKLAGLTEREREVMKLAIIGHPNKEIARHLGISHRTVEIHKSKIMHKTGATNLLDLARIANESNLI